MNRRIFLWQGEAPYTAQSPDQQQPSVTELRVEGSKGAVVVCPGGGYEMKAPYEGEPIAEMLNGAGISAYVLDYRVKPCHCMAPLSDALRAIRLLRSMGYAKVGILGFSAGGNLCCCAATQYTNGDPDAEDPVERFSARPDAFVPCYPVVSLLEYQHLGSREALLGDDVNDISLARYFSAELNITENTPPAFIWHTAGDELVPVQNSLLLAKAMADKGVAFEMHIFPEGNHGLALAQDNPVVGQWRKLCCEWLLREGF